MCQPTTSPGSTGGERIQSALAAGCTNISLGPGPDRGVWTLQRPLVIPSGVTIDGAQATLSVAADVPSALVVVNAKGVTLRGFSIQAHGENHGLPHVLIELRQDQIDTPEGAAGWAARLARLLGPILADPALFEAQR